MLFVTSRLSLVPQSLQGQIYFFLYFTILLFFLLALRLQSGFFSLTPWGSQVIFLTRHLLT